MVRHNETIKQWRYVGGWQVLSSLQLIPRCRPTDMRSTLPSGRGGEIKTQGTYRALCASAFSPKCLRTARCRGQVKRNTGKTQEQRLHKVPTNSQVVHVAWGRDALSSISFLHLFTPTRIIVSVLPLYRIYKQKTHQAFDISLKLFVSRPRQLTFSIGLSLATHHIMILGPLGLIHCRGRSSQGLSDRWAPLWFKLSHSPGHAPMFWAAGQTGKSRVSHSLKHGTSWNSNAEKEPNATKFKLLPLDLVAIVAIVAIFNCQDSPPNLELRAPWQDWGFSSELKTLKGKLWLPKGWTEKILDNPQGLNSAECWKRWMMYNQKTKLIVQ